MSHLVDNLIVLARSLRRSGLPIGTDRIITLIEALQQVDLSSKEDVRAACRATLAQLVASATPRQRSLHALQDALMTEELPLTLIEAAQLVDCNTPERWHEVGG